MSAAHLKAHLKYYVHYVYPRNKLVQCERQIYSMSSLIWLSCIRILATVQTRLVSEITMRQFACVFSCSFHVQVVPSAW